MTIVVQFSIACVVSSAKISMDFRTYIYIWIYHVSKTKSKKETTDRHEKNIDMLVYKYLVCM